MKETKQTGTLTIKTRYGKKSTRSAAKVYGFDYKLKPLKKKKTGNGTNIGGVKKYTWHGATLKAGMTKGQIIKLIGRPNDIKEPLGGTLADRAAMKELLGEKQFNSMDIEQWTYIRKNGNQYEVVVVLFNYKDIVSVILRMY